MTITRPTYVTRAEWGARAPKYRYLLRTPTPRLWVHHTADDRQGAAAVRSHQAYHMDVRGWADIAYSWLVGDDGTIYEGRGFGVVGGHTAGDNSSSHAVCLLGNFEGRAPTRAAVSSLVRLAAYGKEAGYWVPTLGPHRDAPGAATACPGRHVVAQLPSVKARVADMLLSTPTEGNNDMNLPTIIWMPDKGHACLLFPDGALLEGPTEDEQSAFVAVLDMGKEDRVANGIQVARYRSAWRKAHA